MFHNIAILIDAFIKTSHEEEILLKTLKQFKKFNLPILLLSNSTISQTVQKEIDYYFYDKSDLKFERVYDDYEELIFYFSNHLYTYTFTQLYKQTYGLSVLSNYYKGVSLLDSLGFDGFIKIEWDLLIPDEDIEEHACLIEKFKKGELYNGYYRCLNPPPHLENSKNRGRYVECHFILSGCKFFLKHFPKILCEDDYENYLVNVEKDRTFLTDSRMLYACLVRNFYNDKIIETNPDLLNPKNTRLVHTSVSNYPKPFFTETSVKGLFKTNKENVYLLFSENKSYINVENPNWQTINYKINTQKKNLEYTHYINTGCYQYNFVEIFDDEFPIKIDIDGVTTEFKHPNEIFLHLVLK